MTIGLIAPLVVAFASPAAAEPVKIVTWNVKEIFTVGGADIRKSDFKGFADDIDPDIVILQELTSLDEAIAIRNHMGLSSFHVACSDFVQSDGDRHIHFEVAIFSRKPFGQVLEYDPKPDGNPDEVDPDEVALVPLTKIGIQPVGVSRGYLWVEIPDYKITVYAVHLKSSLGREGQQDRSNAEKRELVAAAVAAGVIEDQSFFPGYVHLVAGDFNVGHSDAGKNGTDLDKDCFKDCAANDDLYDETHALLGGGLVAGLQMTNLVAPIMDSTFPSFPGSPIDNIYVSDANKFSSTKRSSKTFGSDHTPVSTVYHAP